MRSILITEQFGNSTFNRDRKIWNQTNESKKHELGMVPQVDNTIYGLRM